MKRLSFLWLLLCLTIFSFAVQDSTVYYLSSTGDGFLLNKLNRFTGNTTVISKSTLPYALSLNAFSDVDKVNKLMYVKAKDDLIAIDLTTGTVKYSYPIGDMNLMVYSCHDQKIYGLARKADYKFYLAVFDPSTGLKTFLSSTAVSNLINVGPQSALNYFDKEFYFQDLGSIVVVDITNGNVKTGYGIQNYFDLMEYNAKDNCLYGMVRDNDVNKLYFSKFSFKTGKFTYVSSKSISTDPDERIGMSISASSELDQYNQYYYFQYAGENSANQKVVRYLAQIDVASGNLLNQFVPDASIYHMELLNICPVRQGQDDTKDTIDITMTIFPNPSKDFIRVSLSEVPADAEVVLFNSLGLELDVQEAQAEVIFDLQELNKGMYFTALRSKRSGVLSRQKVYVNK